MYEVEVDDPVKWTIRKWLWSNFLFVCHQFNTCQMLKIVIYTWTIKQTSIEPHCLHDFMSIFPKAFRIISFALIARFRLPIVFNFGFTVWVGHDYNANKVSIPSLFNLRKYVAAIQVIHITHSFVYHLQINHLHHQRRKKNKTKKWFQQIFCSCKIWRKKKQRLRWYQQCRHHMNWILNT